MILYHLKSILLFFISFFIYVNVAFSSQEIITNYFFSDKIDINFYRELPNLLSKEDIQKYQQVIDLEKKHDIKKSNKVLTSLNDKSLVGYILYMRYMNPSYKPTYKELYVWLENYNDLGIAKDIYFKIKTKYKKQLKTHPPKVPLVFTFAGGVLPVYINSNILQTEEDGLVFSSTNEISPLENKYSKQIAIYLKKGKTKNVSNLLKDKKIIKNINSATFAYYSSKLARLYFLDGRDDDAIFWATKSIKDYSYYLPDSFIILGLSSWRQKKYDLAYKSFNFIIKHKDKYAIEFVAKASYWAAKTALAQEKIDLYFENLKIASMYKYNFYGLLASEELGVKSKFSTISFEPSNEYLDLISRTKYGRRAISLLQLGLVSFAQKEFVSLMNIELSDISDINSKDKILQGLLYVISNTNMPLLSYKLAGTKGSYFGLVDYSYPTLDLEPLNGYELDPTLLLAVMRRESNFDIYAESWVGAKGLMQLMPKTAKMVMQRVGYENPTVKKLSIPEYNIDVGQKYLKLLIENKDSAGNLMYVLAGWNGGFLHVKKWKEEEFRKAESDPVFFLESIPFKETRNFVTNVITDYWIYQLKFGIEPLTLKKLAKKQEPIYDINITSITEVRNIVHKK